jgi:hypothetical protein
MAYLGIVDSEQPSHRQSLSAEDPVEDELVSERQTVWYWIEQCPEPIGGPTAVREVIALQRRRNRGIE